MLMRSKLFVPATRPVLFAKAESSPADSLSFDLEDAVTETRKDCCRTAFGCHSQTLEGSLTFMGGAQPRSDRICWAVQGEGGD